MPAERGCSFCNAPIAHAREVVSVYAQKAAAAANRVARFNSRRCHMRRIRASPGGFENALSYHGTKCELSLN